MPSSAPLDNLVRIGQLKPEPPDRDEFAGLLRSGRLRLEDAANQALSIESRFDLAYNAAHALSLAALRWHGYRSENRYQVFQCLQHTPVSFNASSSSFRRASRRLAALHLLAIGGAMTRRRALPAATMPRR